MVVYRQQNESQAWWLSHWVTGVSFITLSHKRDRQHARHSMWQTTRLWLTCTKFCTPVFFVPHTITSYSVDLGNPRYVLLSNTTTFLALSISSPHIVVLGNPRYDLLSNSSDSFWPVALLTQQCCLGQPSQHFLSKTSTSSYSVALLIWQCSLGQLSLRFIYNTF